MVENSSVRASDQIRSLEANSGSAFVKRLGLNEITNTPRLHLFAWNVGERAAKPNSVPDSILNIVSLEDIRSLAAVYFSRVAPCYNFIEKEKFLQRMEARWLEASINLNVTDPFDVVLCGVAALALLFSQQTAPEVELQLVELARVKLEESATNMPPSLDTATGWLLRVTYLRMTGKPYTAWIASCSCMHVIEAVGLHLDQPTSAVFTGGPIENLDPDIRQRLFGVAQHLNIWISFDVGKTRVALPGCDDAVAVPMAPEKEEFTGHLLRLLPMAKILDPDRTADGLDLVSSLKNVVELMHTEGPLILAQCNLMLCIYRRLGAQDSIIPNHLLDQMLNLAVKGLKSAETLAAGHCPWHHVANVPFQLVCMLLTIDTKASLSLLREAMNTLGFVASIYDTATMREAYSTAYLLIIMHQRRKEEDAKALGDILGLHSGVVAQKGPGIPGTSSLNDSPTAPGIPWLEDLITDLPSLRNFDLEQFLVEDLGATAAQ